MKANAKLMNSLVNEIKGWLLHDENSLSKTLPKLQLRIKDIEKIHVSELGASATDDEALNRLCDDLIEFKYYYKALMDSIVVLQGAVKQIGVIEERTVLTDWFNSEAKRHDGIVAMAKTET